VEHTADNGGNGDDGGDCVEGEFGGKTFHVVWFLGLYGLLRASAYAYVNTKIVPKPGMKVNFFATFST
jgi:hypothetical protein